MLGQKVDIFIMAGKRKQLSNDIKNVIVEMRRSGHKLQEIADTLNIPRGTVSDVVVRFKRRGSVEKSFIQDPIVCWTREKQGGLLG